MFCSQCGKKVLDNRLLFHGLRLWLLRKVFFLLRNHDF